MRSSSARLAVTLVVSLACARAAAGACGERTGDWEAVAATRATASTRCDCAAATGHGAYVRCVVAVAAEAIDAGALRRACRANVVRCAVRSTCGRPGTVACCRSTAAGADRCRLVDPSRCTPSAGGGACIASVASCCDACADASCTPVTTSTTTTVPTKACAVDTDCDDGNGCSVDRCVGGTCRHECVCVGPAGGVSCCPGPAAQCGPRWYATCGDPVCGGHRDHPGVPPCGPSDAIGFPCSPEGATCDPASDCNELRECTTTDPTVHGCPISRRRFKADVRYLDGDDIRRLRDALMRFPLATYRYRGGPPRRHLGFVIDDIEPSPSVDASGDAVDLYGYTTMAVAALQAQEAELRTLRREVAELRRQLAARTTSARRRAP